MASPSGMHIDRYKIKGVLGRGAMSSVHRAWDPKLHREVAVKVVYRDVSNKPKGRQRFHREARAVAALKHPNIVEIYDYSGPDSSSLYLVMELLDGDDLYEIMAKHGPMPDPIVMAVGHEICRALEVAHGAGIIHRDLKPENVLLNAAGRVVLTDFGGVKAFQEDSAVADHPQKTDIIGTPGFMAPEQIRCAELGPPTDIFALGALLYNIATAELPFSGDVLLETLQDVVAGRIIDPRTFKPSIDPALSAVLQRCLAAKPEERFHTAADVRQALKQIIASYNLTDLRDELVEYMEDPAAYGDGSDRRRATRHLDERALTTPSDPEGDAAGSGPRTPRPGSDPKQTGGFVAPAQRPWTLQRGRETLTAYARAHRGALAVAAAVIASASLGAGIVARNSQSRTPASAQDNAQDNAQDSTQDNAQDSTQDNAQDNPQDNPQDNAQDSPEAPHQPIAPQEPRPPEPDDPTATAETPKRSARGQNNRSKTSQRSSLRVEVRGGPATMYLDGKKHGRWTRNTLTLGRGRHIVEARGRGRRLRRAVTATAGKSYVMIFDLKRNRVHGPSPIKRD